jgi:hypothetical protein
VLTQRADLPGEAASQFPFFDISFGMPGLELGPNDSPLHRDPEGSGDNEARPDEMGSGPATPTVDPTSFGATTSIRHPTSGTFDPDAERHDEDELEIVPADDRSLGLTNTADVPPDDWAADTGPTKTP